MKKNRGWAFTLIGVTFAVLCGSYAIWWIVCELPAVVVRAWMIVSTLLLPVVAWAGWWFGNTEARGRLAGIDQAVDKVMLAATRTIGTRTRVRQSMPPAVTLPNVEIRPRQALPSVEIIDL